MNTFASTAFLRFSNFEFVFVHKTSNLLNLAFAPLGQSANTQKDYLQLLKDKVKFIAGILFYYKLNKQKIEYVMH